MAHYGRKQIQGFQSGSHSFTVIVTLGALSPLYLLTVLPTGKEERERDGSKIQRNTTNPYQLLVLLQWNALLKALNSIMKNCRCGGFFNFVCFGESNLLYIWKNLYADRYLDHKCYGLSRPASCLFHG